MMKITLVILILGFFNNSFAQKIVNVVMVGENGITEDVKEANAFIIVKKFDGHF